MPATNETTSPANFVRRVAAMVYDLFLLIAIFFVATLVLLPFNQGEAIPADHWLYRGYLLVICYLFYAWFWTHGGQTLGMRAWQLRAQSTTGTTLTWRQASLRFCMALPAYALFGIGLLWVLFDSQQRALHDRWSDTRIVRVSVAPNA